jgi:WD40 repeat protein
MSDTRAPTFHAFLSYSTWGDYWSSRRVEAFLERFHSVVGRSGVELPAIRVCRDGSDFRQVIPLRPGSEDAIWSRIQSSLAASRRLIVLCSAESAVSKWVDRELRWVLANKDPGSVLLAVTGGEDPVERPQEVIPAAAIEAELHRNQLWYDLRQWRGMRGAKVRDAEDELVRLALDLLERPDDAQPDLATIWQREDLKQRRRTLKLAIWALTVIILIAVFAVWQFLAARESAREAHAASINENLRAREARAASLVRIADAQSEAAPLLAALVYAELDPERAPPDALDVGYRLLAREIPLARLRGHRHAIVDANFAGDRTIVSVDRGGGIRRGPIDGANLHRELAGPSGQKVVDAAIATDGLTWVIAFEEGDVQWWRADSLAGNCQHPGTRPKYLRPSPSLEEVLVIDFDAHALWCKFRPSGQAQARLIALDGRIMEAWLDTGDSRSWLAVTDLGTFWRIDVSDGAARSLRARPTWKNLVGSSQVAWATGGPQGRLTLQVGGDLFMGQIREDLVQLQRVTAPNQATRARYSPDGDLIAVATEEGMVSIYSSAGHTHTLITTLDHRVLFYWLGRESGSGDDQVQSLAITDIGWSPDGRTLATLQGDKMRLWHPRPGEQAEPRIMRGHSGATAIRWTRDGQLVTTLGDEGEIYVWAASDLGMPEQTRVVNQLYSASLDGRSGTLAVGSRSGAIHVFRDGQFHEHAIPNMPDVKCPERRTDLITLVKHESDSGAFWTVTTSGLVTLWEPVSRASYEGRGYCTSGAQFAYSTLLRGVVFVDLANHLNLVDRRGIHTLDETSPPSKLAVMQISPDGRWVVGGTANGDVVRWDLASQHVTRVEHRVHTDKIACVNIDPSSTQVLSTSHDGTAAMTAFDSTGRVTKRWSGDGNWLETCAVGPDMRVVASSTGRAWILDPVNAGAKVTLPHRQGAAHIGSINSILMVPSGDLAVTGGGLDGYATVWRLRAPQALGRVWLGSAITAIVLDARRHGVYIVSEGGLIRYLPLDIGGVQHALRRRTSSELTPAERGELLGESPDDAYQSYSLKEQLHGRVPLATDWSFEIPF